MKNLIQHLKENQRLEITVLLVAMCCFCFSLTIIRSIVAQSTNFLFLNWNLFLAFIPWVLSSCLVLYPQLLKRKIILGSLLFSWLLFFPNAPYILTDLFHLKQRVNSPLWFDLGLLLSFAWTGLILGFTSLIDIEHILKQRFQSTTRVHIAITLLLFVCSFGVYIGRFLRWNSWDVISDPSGILGDIFRRIAAPMHHPQTWGMTILFGILLNMIYWTVKLLSKRQQTLKNINYINTAQ